MVLMSLIYLTCGAGFLRGVDSGANQDPDRDSRKAINEGGNIGDAVGSLQDDSTSANGLSISGGAHQHSVTKNQTSRSHEGVGRFAGGSEDYEPSGMTVPSDSSEHSHIINGAKETRPKNAYVFWLIRAK